MDEEWDTGWDENKQWGHDAPADCPNKTCFLKQKLSDVTCVFIALCSSANSSNTFVTFKFLIAIDIYQ